MNQKKKGLVAFVLMLCIISLAAISFAGPIPGSLALTPGSSVAGESDLNANSGSTQVNVDWVVSLNSAGTIYTYSYQLENTASDIISNFSLNISNGVVGSIISVGIAAGDLDTVHNFPNFANLAGEEETATTPGGTVVASSVISGATSSIKWTYLGDYLQPGEESQTLFFTSSIGPTYGNGTVQDSIVNWASTNPGSDKLPVPAPEPTTFLGGALGLAAVALYARRRKKVA